MRHLTEKSHQQLLALLDEAFLHLRFAASEQALRAKACKAVKEQILWRYHADQHQLILNVLSDIREHQITLRALPNMPAVREVPSRRAA